MPGCSKSWTETASRKRLDQKIASDIEALSVEFHR